jgi:hypothetical protein
MSQIPFSVSRRYFVQHALMSFLLTSPVVAGCKQNSSRNTFSGRILIPSGVRVRGVCLGPAPADYSGGNDIWARMWNKWDWSGWIQPAVDNAAILGANCIRSPVGSPDVVTSGMISQAQYLAQWKQLIDYSATKGMYFYAVGGDFRHWGPYTTFTAACDLFTAWAELLCDYGNIIGVDVISEAPGVLNFSGSMVYSQPESWFFTARRLGEIVRQVSGKPITYALTASGAWDWATQYPPMVQLMSISDFLDFHVYYCDPDGRHYAAPAATDADVVFTHPYGAGKQLIIGEFGINQNYNSTSHTAYYNAIKNLINHSTDFIGGLAWEMYDDVKDPGSQFGLYNKPSGQGGTARTDITVPFGSFPTTR